MMETDAKSLQEWQQLGFYIFKTETLVPSQTYPEWLSQHPEGYISTGKSTAVKQMAK